MGSNAFRLPKMTASELFTKLCALFCKFHIQSCILHFFMYIKTMTSVGTREIIIVILKFCETHQMVFDYKKEKEKKRQDRS